jgi:hypothetical protein
MLKEVPRWDIKKSKHGVGRSAMADLVLRAPHVSFVGTLAKC